VRRIETPALLVRGVPHGESDLVATFFTETDGKLAAIVRGARRSTKRFGGALEPMHEVSLVLEDKGRDLCVLKEARVTRPRLGLTSDLDAMEAAGRALRWVRHLCPSRTPEPAAWARLRELLDLLDARGGAPDLSHLATFGLLLLAEVGYALDWERCVRCGRPCPAGKPAMIDAAGGGLVCTTCGGARRTIQGVVREAAARAQRRSPDAVMTRPQANEILAIVEDAMATHTDFDALGRPAR
jgi:DNA repair protein RecO (recombination protein O)